MTHFVDDRMSSPLSHGRKSRQRQDEDNNALLPVGDLIQAAQRLLEDEVIQEARHVLEEETERTHEKLNAVNPRKRDKSRKASAITDHAIYRFILRNNGNPTRKDEILHAFCKNEETRRIVTEKLSTMERFNLIAVKEGLVTLRKR